MFTNILSRRRTTRARAESDAYILDVAARAVRVERYRRQGAFDRALDQFATEQPTRVVLAGYLDAVTA